MAKPKKGKSSSNYGADQIQVLEGLDPVRKRPGMYIGSTGEAGLHHMVWEIVDNSVDEAMAGHCKNIDVILEKNGACTVIDDGRGIPVEIHKQTKKSTLETALTVLHAGGKFGGDASGYKVSGGLHGVGVSVVNALSTNMHAEVKRDGKRWVQDYKRGKPTGKVKPVGPARGTGTLISFIPDPEILQVTTFNLKEILLRMRQYSYLTKGIRINIFDQRDRDKLPEVKDAMGEVVDQKTLPRSYSFYFEGGVKSYIRALNKHRELVNDTIFYVDKEKDGMAVEIALQYTNDYGTHQYSYANHIHTTEGGEHLVGFNKALTRIINSYGRRQGILKENQENLTGEDVREGLTAVVSLKLPNPQFEGQTKAKLGNPEARTTVESVFAEAFTEFLEMHPADAKKILAKGSLAAAARKAAKAARDTVIRKGAFDGFSLPGKLADCTSKDATISELFIVEGDSAGGSAKQGRDRNFQAILPLKGKILNVEKGRLDKMLAFEEIKALTIAIGAGIGTDFELDKTRYNKIIIMTDADVDGAHIRTLLLTLFFRYFRAMVDAGHLFIAQPPLYKVSFGKETRYVYSDAEKDKAVKELEELANSRKKPGKVKEKVVVAEAVEGEEGAEGETEEAKGPRINIQRYKGLGEMNPEQLWDTTMDPKVRKMLRVTVDDAATADTTFQVLMGSDVAPRKKFIQTHAKAVKNLDI